MMNVVTVGLDLAKNVFQVHGVDADGRFGVRRKLRRADVNGGGKPGHGAAQNQASGGAPSAMARALAR